MKKYIDELFKSKKLLFLTIGTIFAVSILIAFIFLPYAFGIEAGIFPKQKIEEISFSEGKLSVQNGESKYIVTVENTSAVAKNINLIEVIFKNTEGKEEQLFGYIGSTLSPNEKKILEVSVEDDLTDMKEVKYIIR